MRSFNYISAHKLSILSFLLVVAAAALGADSSFAMAVDGPVLADPANPSSNMAEYDASTNAGGRPADEALKSDEQGGSTQLPNHPATATDVRDAGLEAEDFDQDIVNFRKFRFPVETYIAMQCKPVKADSYIKKHFRIGTTNLDAVYNGADITITGGSDASITISGVSTKVYDHAKRELSLPTSLFENPECLTPYSTVYVSGVEGYATIGGSEVEDGELALFVLDNKGEDGNVKFRMDNEPLTNSNSIEIAGDTVFLVGATACSESQIRVAPETILPEQYEVTLQKKNMTVVVTDEFESQDKKTGFGKNDVLANAMYNFRRKCARTHWLGKSGRIDVKVAELNNAREADYKEQGILRQIPMLYTHGNDLSDDDMMAITSLMFTDNSASDSATVFCAKKEMKRIMKLVNSATHFKDVSKVEVNKYGIKVRNWTDNFGSLEFIYDPTLDDIRYQDFMVVCDLRNAVRYYKRNEKTITQDMSQTGESREATAYNKSIIDCVCLKGYNAVLVTTNANAQKASKLGGIIANFTSVSALPSGDDLTSAAKALKYYLTADDSAAGYLKGTIVEWDEEIEDWKEFEGLVRNA